MAAHNNLSAIDLEVLHNNNTAALLSFIWSHGPISRTELAQQLGIAHSSVTRLTRELENAHLVREVRVGASTGGRPPRLLAFDANAGVVVGVDLSGVQLRGAVVDALGRQLASRERPFVGLGPVSIQQQVEEVVAALLADPAVASRRVLGIGVSAPGTVDLATGTIVDVTNLQLQDFPAGALLRQRFHLPVIVEHDTAAAAYAEKQYGAGRGFENLIYITVSTGIGAGIVLGNSIYRGEGGGAGELGHITVERGGPLCLCGKRGCLEAVAAAPAIVAHACRLLQQAEYTGASSLPIAGLTIEAIVQAAASHDPVAVRVLQSAADYLAQAIATLVCILSVRRVLVGGEVAQAGAAFFEPLQASLGLYQLYSNPATVVPAQLQQDAALNGVSMLALQHVLGLTR